MTTFLSGPPVVRLVNAFERPFENAVATARTCYSSKGIITSEEVGGDKEKSEVKKAEKAERRDSLAKSIYEAGHHTTLQHAHFQFALDRVSRHCIWGVSALASVLQLGAGEPAVRGGEARELRGAAAFRRSAEALHRDV